MSQFPIGQRPPRSHSEPSHDVGWEARPAPSRSAVGDDDGVTQPPPPCADPGTRELVAPDGAGSPFSFQMPQCFRPTDDEVDLTETESRNVTGRTVIVPVEVVITADDPVSALVIVSASGLGSDVSAVSDEALEAQLWRNVDRVGIAAVSPIRRTVDGARGWRFTLVQPVSESLIWVFVKRTAQIQVICRWTDPTLRTRIGAGCDQLIDTLTVT